MTNPVPFGSRNGSAGWQAAQIGEAPPQSLARFQLYAAGAILFVVTASNGRPFFTSSGVWAPALAVLLIMTRGLSTVLTGAFTRSFWVPTSLLIALSMWALFCAAASQSWESVIGAVEIGALPFLIYLSLTNLALREAEQSFLLACLASGSAVLGASGLLAFYQEWGIPNLETLLWARFDVKRIAGYGDALLGSMGNIGEYCAIIIPPLLFGAMSPRIGRSVRALLAAALAIAFSNLVICGTRAAMLVMIVALVQFIVSGGARRLVGYALASIAAAAYLAPLLIGAVGETELLRRFFPAFTATGVDQSQVERLESIQVGWQTFLDHLLVGVGPGMSYYYNIYFVPHESLVLFLSETGVLGGALFASLAAMVLIRSVKTTFEASRNLTAHYQIMWASGVLTWLIYGLIAGTQIHVSLALVWIGIANAILALMGAVTNARVGNSPGAPGRLG